ncbi:MAG: hypothetical protein ACRDA5_01435 [Clostridium sp.]
MKKKLRIEVTQELIDKMVALKKQGLISGCIADQLGINVSTVYKYTKEFDYQNSDINSKNFDARRKKEQIVIEAIKDGFSEKEASKKANTTIGNVSRIIKRHNLKVLDAKKQKTDREIEIENNRIIFEKLKEEQELNCKNQLELEKQWLSERYNNVFDKIKIL